jgi:hypothetical protein
MKGIYTTYKSWLAAAKKAGAVRLDGDEDIAMAFDKNGRGVAEWDGAEGYIYKVKSMIDGSLTFKNPRDARASSRKEEYGDFDEWQRDAFAAGATQVVKIGDDAFSAIRTMDGSKVPLDDEGFFDARSRYAVKNRNNILRIGSWYMDSGTIYRHIIKNRPEFFAYENPLRPRKGESSRAFVSRCMSEEKMSFPEPKQRIAVCLSKSRKRNPVYDTGSDE